jgi:glycine betaine catabolism A
MGVRARRGPRRRSGVKLAGFDRDGYSLVPLSIVEWHGWFFANASGDAPAFGEHIGNLGELIKNHRPEELVTTARHDYEVAANWKVELP